jgi:MoaE-MoaD fusion protein
MRITVRLFAALAEAAGARSLTLELEPGSRAADVRYQLAERFPKVRGLCDRAALAVNAEYTDAGRVLHDEDEVALIPPVSGG